MPPQLINRQLNAPQNSQGDIRHCEVRHCVSEETRQALTDGTHYYDLNGSKLDEHFYELPSPREALITLMKLIAVVVIIGCSFYLIGEAL